MGGKAKAQKHTAKEINKKIQDAKFRAGGAGGGSAGAEKRKCQKVGVKCEICKQEFMSMPDIRIHSESKHPKAPFPEEQYSKAFADAKEATLSKTRTGQQNKLDYKQKGKATGSTSGKKKSTNDDVAALLASGLANDKLKNK